MKKEGYYSSGEFMKLGHITKKTIRYYDEHNILPPSYVSPSGFRYYTDKDLATLQQITLFKFLGFSLEDIREMTIHDMDNHYISSSLNLQLKLIEDRMDQLKLVAKAIQGTSELLHNEGKVDWSHMLELIHHFGMENSMKNQYQNSSNISSRINLHNLYAQNPQGWFPWIFSQCDIRPSMHILEIGCGDGSFWKCNLSSLPESLTVILSDISEGMLRDTRRTLGTNDSRFAYQCFDCQHIPYPDDSFDLIFANHVLFYCDDIPAVCAEVKRVLRPNGHFICSTYGSRHMQEVAQLAHDFDDRIILSAENLYCRFGRENGADILKKYYNHIQWHTYEDSLLVTEADALISYILSCHGNQNQYILNRYKDFRNYVKKQTAQGYHITKDAGIFICSIK